MATSAAAAETIASANGGATMIASDGATSAGETTVGATTAGVMNAGGKSADAAGYRPDEDRL